MTNNHFKQLSQSMKENNIDITKLTDMVNKWQDDFHVCEQEMMNYLLKNEPMPEELELVLIDMFNLEDEQGGDNCSWSNLNGRDTGGRA